jgi:hypothetical protein
MYIEVRNDFVYFDSDVKQVIYQFGVWPGFEWNTVD